MMYLLLAVGFLSLARGTGTGGSGFMSVLFNSTSPGVSRFFTVEHKTQLSSISLFSCENVPATEDILVPELFTFLVKQLIPTSSSCTHLEQAFF